MEFNGCLWVAACPVLGPVLIRLSKADRSGLDMSGLGGWEVQGEGWGLDMCPRDWDWDMGLGWVREGPRDMVCVIGWAIDMGWTMAIGWFLAMGWAMDIGWFFAMGLVLAKGWLVAEAAAALADSWEARILVEGQGHQSTAPLAHLCFSCRLRLCVDALGSSALTAGWLSWKVKGGDIFH